MRGEFGTLSLTGHEFPALCMGMLSYPFGWEFIPPSIAFRKLKVAATPEWSSNEAVRSHPYGPRPDRTVWIKSGSCGSPTHKSMNKVRRPCPTRRRFVGTDLSVPGHSPPRVGSTYVCKKRMGKCRGGLQTSTGGGDGERMEN